MFHLVFSLLFRHTVESGEKTRFVVEKCIELAIALRGWSLILEDDVAVVKRSELHASRIKNRGRVTDSAWMIPGI